MIYFIVLFSQDLRIKLKLGTSLSKQAHNGLYSDINTSYLQFSLKLIEQALFILLKLISSQWYLMNSWDLP